MREIRIDFTDLENRTITISGSDGEEVIEIDDGKQVVTIDEDGVEIEKEDETIEFEGGTAVFMGCMGLIGCGFLFYLGIKIASWVSTKFVDLVSWLI